MNEELDYSKYAFDIDFLKVGGRSDFWRDVHDSAMNSFSIIMKQKDDLIKSKLEEKGFGHLIKGIEKKRFPKITSITKDNWSYIYADNDTDEGAFIVAMEDYNFDIKYSKTDFTTKFETTFVWQDTIPLKKT